METKLEKDKELHRVVTTILIYTAVPEQSSVHGKNLKYLITKRAMHKKMMPGKQTIPGGGLSVDDYINLPVATNGAPQWYGALEIAMRREIKEEVNLEMGKPELLTDLTFIRPDGIPCICFSYFAPYVSGVVKLDEDATEFAWVTLEEAKNYDLIEGIWDEIRQIEGILKRRK